MADWRDDEGFPVEREVPPVRFTFRAYLSMVCIAGAFFSVGLLLLWAN